MGYDLHDYTITKSNQKCPGYSSLNPRGSLEPVVKTTALDSKTVNNLNNSYETL